jgi:hypothetical protein
MLRGASVRQSHKVSLFIPTILSRSICKANIPSVPSTNEVSLLSRHPAAFNRSPSALILNGNASTADTVIYMLTSFLQIQPSNWLLETTAP